MTKYLDHVDQTFSALADPTRRAIVSRLCNGPASIGELSEPFDIALPTLLKHVRVLERNGLVTSKKVGRVRTCKVETKALRATESWLHQHIAQWEARLDRLDAYLDDVQKKKSKK